MTRDAGPADLEMRVKTASENGRTRLIYTLHSPTGAVSFSHQEIAGPFLQGSPEEYQAHLLRKIEGLGERLDVDGSYLLRAEINRKLTSLGRGLWRELFPAEIRYAYREIRLRIRSWMIFTDEPWIPWELVKPYDDSRPEDVIDDDFLAFQFELTRWLSGGKTPAQEIVVRSLAAFLTARDLPQAKEELKLLDSFEEAGVLDTKLSANSAGELVNYLETYDVGLIHIIGHGVYNAGQVDESGVPFPDGSVLRPVDLDGPVATRIGRNRPLVFLNACSAGLQGWALTRLGGWAARWVRLCGCGCFVAPLWPVRDQAALAFAWAFYDALAQGSTLGQAALAARLHVRRERQGDPSVLAYTVYGHPNARLRLGGDADAPDVLAERPVLLDGLPRPRVVKTRRRIPPSLRPRRSVVTAASGALAFALALHLAAGPILDLLFPMDERPGPSFTLPTPTKTASEPAPKLAVPDRAVPKKEVTTSVATGGLRFEVSGGQARLNSVMRHALKGAAAPLVEEGVSGWTISLKLDPPDITSHNQEGFDMKACRLTGEASARGASSIDLGPVDTINSQFDGGKACEAATEPLAEAVLTRFVNALGTKGEP